MKINKEELNDVIEWLYNLNATISLRYIGLKEKPNEKTMEYINHHLGNAIKRLREISDKSS